MFLVYNSDILPESDFRLSVNDRAFQYGDGLFETIRYEQEQIWFWSDHFARLSAGMDALQLNYPILFTDEALYQLILQLLTANQLAHQTARIKIQVWRQPGGLYTPSTNEASFLITAKPGQPFLMTKKTNVSIYETCRLSPSPVSPFKTLNALPYVLAGLYKTQHDLDEIMLLDTEGHVAECLASNLFWYANKTLYTPSLQTGCINGILRRQLLRLAPTAGLTVVETLVKPTALRQVEAVFCANVMGIQWLLNLQDRPLYKDLPTFVNAQELLNPLFAQLHS